LTPGGGRGCDEAAVQPARAQGREQRGRRPGGEEGRRGHGRWLLLLAAWRVDAGREREGDKPRHVRLSLGWPLSTFWRWAGGLGACAGWADLGPPADGAGQGRAGQVGFSSLGRHDYSISIRGRHPLQPFCSLGR